MEELYDAMRGSMLCFPKRTRLNKNDEEVSTFLFGVSKLQKSNVQNKILTTGQLVSEF